MPLLWSYFGKIRIIYIKCHDVLVMRKEHTERRIQMEYTVWSQYFLNLPLYLSKYLYLYKIYSWSKTKYWKDT